MTCFLSWKYTLNIQSFCTPHCCSVFIQRFAPEWASSWWFFLVFLVRNSARPSKTFLRNSKMGERERAVRIADGYSGVFSATFRSNYKTAEVMDVATSSSGITRQSPDEDRGKNFHSGVQNTSINCHPI